MGTAFLIQAVGRADADHGVSAVILLFNRFDFGGCHDIHELCMMNVNGHDGFLLDVLVTNNWFGSHPSRDAVFGLARICPLAAVDVQPMPRLVPDRRECDLS
jgi:hypothetical protein